MASIYFKSPRGDEVLLQSYFVSLSKNIFLSSKQKQWLENLDYDSVNYIREANTSQFDKLKYEFSLLLKYDYFPFWESHILLKTIDKGYDLKLLADPNSNSNIFNIWFYFINYFSSPSIIILDGRYKYFNIFQISDIQVKGPEINNLNVLIWNKRPLYQIFFTNKDFQKLFPQEDLTCQR